MRRIIGWVLLFWFTFGAVDPYGWHLRCPMDNPLAAAASHQMAGMDMMQCHGGHSHNKSTSSHQCCCLGACCCSAVLNVDPGRLVALPVVPVTVVRTRFTVVDARPPMARPDVVLPPAVGPPASRV